VSSEAETMVKRRLSADPRRERNPNNAQFNTNDSVTNYQSSKGTGSSKQGSSNSRFVDQSKVYSSLQALPKQ